MGTARIVGKDGKVIEYHIENRLKRNLDEKVIPYLHQKDKDCVLIVDGREGSGKSWFAMQIGRYVDNTLDLNRVCFAPDEFREAVFKAKKGQCVIYDEAFTGYSSRSSLSPINRVLVSLAMQIRQKNLFIIIILPTIFLLDRYMALFRARALIHIFESKGTRGYFRFYNYRLKKLLIIFGQKTMSYNSKVVRTNFKGRFYGKFALGDEKVEDLYRKKKSKALEESEKNPMTSQQVKFKEQRDILIHLIRKMSKFSYRELSELFEEYNISMSYVQIRTLCSKFGDTETEKDKKDGKEDEKEIKTPEFAEIKDIDEELEEIEVNTNEFEQETKEIDKEQPKKNRNRDLNGKKKSKDSKTTSLDVLEPNTDDSDIDIDDSDDFD